MKTASTSLVFTPTPTSIAVAITFVLIIAGLSFMAWRRSGFRTSVGMLEALRTLIALGIAVTLNQPEWREVFKPDNKPTLVVLADISRSMETRDVIDAANPSAEPTSRADLAKPLTDLAAWRAVAEKMDVVVETFSSSQEPAEEGTDINAALLQAAEKHARLSAVVLLSDGDWNSGDAPAQAATRLRMREVPVFVVPLGAETCCRMWN